jgi:hypothetical protein
MKQPERRATMNYFIQGGALKNLRIVLLIAALIVFHEGRGMEVSANSSDEDSREILLLQKKLKTTIEEESALRAKIKEETRLAVQPFADYLLYQKSIHFFEYSTRLEQLKKEHMAIALDIVRLQNESGSPIDSPLKGGEETVVHLFPVYSGAPPFSFYDPSRFESRDLFPYHPFRTNLFRLMISVAILFVFFFPAIAVWKGMMRWRNEEIVRIYPILSVPRADGRTEALQFKSARRSVR